MSFLEILNQPESPDRVALIAEWFQALFADNSVPILVGGAAVELYTGGAYTTGDLDFVGLVPDSVADALLAEGFQKAGRHWVHEAGEVFIELPSSSLQPDERTSTLELSGARVLIVAVEELIVDRLAAWEFWGSDTDAVNALLIWRSNRIDLDRLETLAARQELTSAFESLVSFNRSCGEGTAPSAEDLERWAQKR